MTTDMTGFHPLIREWFLGKYPSPTDVQANAWPKIAQNRHVLISSPTGSGKTLTAFLWAVNRFATGKLTPGATRVLYVSPLKALNNDVQKNLKQPLAEIREIFRLNNELFPDIRVLTRSGDTPQEERRKMFRHPPEILITTPESLNLLLSSKSGLRILHHLETVILDEIHSVASTKRGVHLITAVDRLVRLSGEFQRICLSATIKNTSTVAAFVGGFVMQGSPVTPEYIPREFSIIKSAIKKDYNIQVNYPQKEDADVTDSVWDLLAHEFVPIVEKNRSTLFFTNGRRLCEKMTFKINRLAGKPVAWSHHGSLSRALRQSVEQNLKNGELKAIVATSSLEMGIDIGSLDEVVLIQSPPSVSSAIQRIGRAGHQVGGQSRGTLFCAHAQDLIASAVLAKAIDNHDIEALEPIECPLDVLSQVLVSMTCMEEWDMEQLYVFIRSSYPFHHLTRNHYDLVLNMLAGKYADTRIRELKPRVSIDRLDNTVAGKKGALLALYTSGGTIPDRGYYSLRHHDTGARIGELDEEYVWEAKIGQIATIGTQNWKITKITHNDVFVLAAGSSRMDAPFWIAEGINRNFHFSGRILAFLERAQASLADKGLEKSLTREYHLDPWAAKELIRFLKKQVQVTGCDLPHQGHILLETVRTGPDGGSPGSMLVIHTLWGGALNRPWALALEAAWERQFKEVPEIFPGNDAIVIQLPHQMSAEEVLSLVTPAKVEDLLKQQLEKSGFFAARFREAAGRALLVVKNRINQRMPLWMSRLKSKKLLENILKYADFPILLEAWRTCLKDEFDLPRLQEMLEKLQTGEISCSHAQTSRPSPFAAGMAWNQINQYMYKEDEGASVQSSLGQDLVKELVFSPALRPMIAPALVKAFENKCQRCAPGYAPETARELLDWVKERIAVPMKEWDILIAQVKKDTGNIAEIEEETRNKLVVFHIRHNKNEFIVSRELAARIKQAWFKEHSGISIMDVDENVVHIDQDIKEGDKGDSSLLLGQWLQFYGPVSDFFVEQNLGIDKGQVKQMLAGLAEEEQIISGRLVKGGADNDICDSDNFETLLRMSRARAVPEFEPLDSEELQWFLARHQGLTEPGHTIDDLFDRLEQLLCLPLPAGIWESEVLPARLQPYHPSFMDTILQEGDLLWLGYPKQKISFCFASDLDLQGLEAGREQEPETKADGDNESPDDLDRVFREDGSRFEFTALMGLTGYDTKTLVRKLWEKVFATRLCNETFSAVRKGLETRFRLPDSQGPKSRPRFGRRSRPGRSSFSRWKGTAPLTGHWFFPAVPKEQTDLLQKEEVNRDRVRLLLERYGILFRELLAKEMPQFAWQSVFRSLRLMELSGEILSGVFFKDVPGLQFISHRAFRTLTTAAQKESFYMINAADPASVCGLPLHGVRQALPRRLPGCHMVFFGKALKLVSTKEGKQLEFSDSPQDDGIVETLSLFSRILTRQFNPKKKIVVETINGVPAPKSLYINDLETVFEVVKEYKSVTLFRKPDSFF